MEPGWGRGRWLDRMTLEVKEPLREPAAGVARTDACLEQGRVRRASLAQI